jgi:hypothetical protein
MADDDLAERLIDALTALEEVADGFTPDEAVGALDAASLQVFWRDWPQVSGWAGALWRRLDADLAAPARPPQDQDLDEVGGSG